LHLKIQKVLPVVLILKDARVTFTGSIRLTPGNPRDHHRLFHFDWNNHPNIGSNMKTSLEKSKTILRRLLILRVDMDIEDQDIEEVLTEQGITTSAVSRLKTKEQKATNKVVVLKDGVYLGFSHHKCEGNKIQ
jgi:hypothetical protein